ncbi:MAG: anthranilate synthase component I family protein [Thermoanaerobaculia bacterium]|nr:anthranilate synthase component I family protein [Thermoanaerobaculia bacterium]
MTAPARAVAHAREFLADRLTPVEVYRRLGELSPVRFLLESVTGGDQVSRYSFLGAGPRRLYRLYGDRLDTDGGPPEEGPPLTALRRALSAVRGDAGPIPFQGGWVGWFGYELVRLLERLPAPERDPHGLPLAVLGRFDDVVVFDHARQRVVAVASEIEGERDGAAAARGLDRLSELLAAGATGGAVALPGLAGDPPPRPRPSLDDDAYREAVRTVQERIVAGDVFQTVLARRWTLPGRVEPLLLYRALRSINPSPYMVLFEGPEASLVGASPEMLVKRSGPRLETRPIAGTRRRGGDAAADRRLATELLADEKERAEHLMLVDLGRNDLGRVSTPGSVAVPEFMEIERYSHVMHIVSRVEGELASGRDALDALLACFPAGTVSGAPKIRAMELIAELEPERRGPYAGAVGYLSYSGDLDTCITIRTLLVRDDEVSVTAGAGIVADSDPDAEARETEGKAEALLAAVELARRLSP